MKREHHWWVPWFTNGLLVLLSEVEGVSCMWLLALIELEVLCWRVLLPLFSISLELDVSNALLRGAPSPWSAPLESLLSLARFPEESSRWGLAKPLKQLLHCCKYMFIPWWHSDVMKSWINLKPSRCQSYPKNLIKHSALLSPWNYHISSKEGQTQHIPQRVSSREWVELSLIALISTLSQHSLAGSKYGNCRLGKGCVAISHSLAVKYSDLSK